MSIQGGVNQAIGAATVASRATGIKKAFKKPAKGAGKKVLKDRYDRKVRQQALARAIRQSETYQEIRKQLRKK